MRQTSSITFWFSTVLRRACPSFSHAPREPCSPTPDQDHVRGQRPLEAPAFSDSWHDLADVHVYTCEYIYIHIIHTQHNHTHAYIHTYCKSCVLKQNHCHIEAEDNLLCWSARSSLVMKMAMISGEMSHISLKHLGACGLSQ